MEFVRTQATSRAWCAANVETFRATSTASIIGHLTSHDRSALLPTQSDAWIAQIEILRAELTGLSGSLFFEFSIPRMGKRVDVALRVGPVVFVLEFKVGARTFDADAVDQGLGLRARPQELPRGEPRRGDRASAHRHRRGPRAAHASATRSRRRVPADVRDVPPGCEADPTRHPAHYDATYQYLRDLGIEAIG